MVRVLHIALTEHIGGIETLLLNLYQNIDRTKVQFDFVSQDEHPAYENQFRKLGAQIYFLSNGLARPISYYRQLAHIIRRGNYAVVHIHKNSAANLLPFLVCKQLKIKTIIAHAHNTASNFGGAVNTLHKINKSFLPLLCTDAFACSESAAKWLFPKSMLNKVKIIKNGTCTDKYVFDTNIRKSVRDQMHLTNCFVVGHIGRFVQQKNHSYLIQIFNEVHSKYPKSVLLLVGSGKFEPNIRNQVKQLGLEDSVLFLGERSDVPQLMQAMDVFVFPSLYEGLPVTLIEAQAVGLPCIVSDTITREADVTTGLIDWLSLSSSPQEWAKHIMRYQHGFQRKDTAEQIRVSGYDIAKATEYLERFYIQRYRSI